MSFCSRLLKRCFTQDILKIIKWKYYKAINAEIMETNCTNRYDRHTFV